MSVVTDVKFSNSKAIIGEGIIIHNFNSEVILLSLEGKSLIECNFVSSFLLHLGPLFLIAQFEFDVGVLPLAIFSTFLEKGSSSTRIVADMSLTCNISINLIIISSTLIAVYELYYHRLSPHRHKFTTLNPHTQFLIHGPSS